MRNRVYVDWEGVLTELYAGVTVIGRDFDCRIRSNDSMVSRHHLRFIVGDEGTVLVEDLKSTNGTFLNGKPVTLRTALLNGDELQIGSRKFRLRIESYDAKPLDAAATTQESLAAEVKPAKSIIEHACPRCRSAMPKTQGICASCNYRAPFARPTATTAEMRVPDVAEDRRDEARRSVYVPVCYASENLTFDGVARDLSRGGVFVETEFLETIDTICHITMLPEGAPPVTFEGRVAHVVASAGDATKCGLGLQFTRLGPEAEAWLLRTLETAKR
jgi:pSer/pThr/pTyr-binding forkhead associated (FHA) protein